MWRKLGRGGALGEITRGKGEMHVWLCRCLLNAQTQPPLIAHSQQSDIVSLHIVKLLYSHLYLAMYVALYLCAHPQHSRCERFSLNPWSAYAGC